MVWRWCFESNVILKHIIRGVVLDRNDLSYKGREVREMTVTRHNDKNDVPFGTATKSLLNNMNQFHTCRVYSVLHSSSTYTRTDWNGDTQTDM